MKKPAHISLSPGVTASILLLCCENVQNSQAGDVKEDSLPPLQVEIEDTASYNVKRYSSHFSICAIPLAKKLAGKQAGDVLALNGEVTILLFINRFVDVQSFGNFNNT